MRSVETGSIIFSALEVGAASAEAVWVFELNARRHPHYWNAYDSPGAAYMRSGRTQGALRSYERSLHLNAENLNAKKRLEALRR